jgi:hypothetical protein
MILDQQGHPDQLVAVVAVAVVGLLLDLTPIKMVSTRLGSLVERIQSSHSLRSYMTLAVIMMRPTAVGRHQLVLFILMLGCLYYQV